jgi:type II secretory pathway component PulK
VERAGDRKLRERGVTLVLAFLVVLILVAVVGKLTVTSAVDRSVARNRLDEMRCEFAARGAAEVAKALLAHVVRNESRVLTSWRSQ